MGDVVTTRGDPWASKPTHGNGWVPGEAPAGMGAVGSRERTQAFPCLGFGARG